MTVSFFGCVKEYTSDEEVLTIGSADSIRVLIDVLGRHYGDEFKDFLLSDDTCIILVNGGGIMATGGLDTPLSDGDTVEVLPFVDGG